MSAMLDTLFITAFFAQLAILFITVYNVMKACDIYQLRGSFIMFSLGNLSFGIMFFIMMLNYNVEFYYSFIILPSLLYILYGMLFIIEVVINVGRIIKNPFRRGE